MKERIVLIGGGGHCKVVIDAINCGGKYSIAGILDPKLTKDEKVLGVPVLGNDDELAALYGKKIKNAFITVGSVGDSTLRKKLYEKAKDVGFSFPVIIHPKSVIAEDVLKNIGEGTFIAASATVNPGTVIGKNVIINTASSIDHDCVIGDFVQVSPGATLSGDVKIDEGIHVGTGTNISHGSRLDNKNCDHKKIKAGSVVYYSNVRKITHISWPFGSPESGDKIG